MFGGFGIVRRLVLCLEFAVVEVLFVYWNRSQSGGVSAVDCIIYTAVSA